MKTSVIFLIFINFYSYSQTEDITDNNVNSYDYETLSILNARKYKFTFENDTFNICVPNKYIVIIDNRSRNQDSTRFIFFEPHTRITIRQINKETKKEQIKIHFFKNPNYLYTNTISDENQLMSYAKNNMFEGRLDLDKIKIKWYYSKEWKNKQKIHQMETILFSKKEKSVRFAKITIASDRKKELKNLIQIIESLKEI